MSEFGISKRLEGKVALITGGGSGIGRYTSRLFAAQGAKVAVADMNAANADETVKMIADDGNAGSAIAISLNVASEDEWKSAAAQVIEKLGKIDILVNCAGLHREQHISQISLADWKQTFSVNLDGVFIGMQTVIPQMLKQGGGSIVNIASIAGMIASDFAHYSASKGGVIALSRSAAISYAKQGIRVNSICPGLIETNLTKDALQVPEIRKMLEEATALPFFGQPKDIAFGILFLASDEGRFATGANFIIDGGVTAK